MTEPYFADESVTLYLGKSEEVLTEFDEASIDAIVCDPPYELGFMGKGWDASGIAYSVPLWTAALRVLKPGGHLLAFGGTRTYHRMTCAIEDAGFEIRDCLSWLYGSGFPKSHNLDGDWSGWGTALKPAFEPVVLARKTFSGTVAANVTKYGTGAIHIDDCRLEGQAESFVDNRTEKNNTVFSPFNPSDYDGSKGRWPANVLLDEGAAVILDEQTGVSSSGQPREDRGEGGIWSSGDGIPVGPQYGDFGGASRFFYTAKASKQDRGEGNDHPTVKPVDLMRWLIRLITPPNGVVLDPFAGSGSTLQAAISENRKSIGIEMEAHHVDLIVKRLERPIPVAMFDV